MPDVFVSLDVERPQGWELKDIRAYYIWEFEKVPDVAVEIVSNKKGGEIEAKRKRYAKLGVTYYVVFDPLKLLKGDLLYVYEPGFGNRYRRRDDYNLPGMGLSLTLWDGVFEGAEATWLRWCNAKGEMIPTAYEYAHQAEDRANQAEGRAVQAEGRANQAEAENNELRVELERLRAQLNQAPQG